MKFFFFAGIVCLFSCKKVDTKVDNIRVLQITVKDYRSTANANLTWGIDFSFSTTVTLNGSVNVEYDIYNQGILFKHFSYKVELSLNNATVFTYNTLESALTSGAEIKNIKVSGLKTDGGYSITIMDPIGRVSGSGSGSSGGCGTHNGHSLNKGPNGGCYYINSNGNKTYVDASECHC